MSNNDSFFQRLRKQMKVPHYLGLALILIVGIGMIGVAIDGDEEEVMPEFSSEWEALEYKIRKHKFMQSTKTSITDIKINQHYEYPDQRIVLIYLNQDNPSKKFMLNDVRSLLHIMQPYNNINEIAIFSAIDGMAIMKYAIDGHVLRLQNLDILMIDDLPLIASDYFVHNSL